MSNVDAEKIIVDIADKHISHTIVNGTDRWMISTTDSIRRDICMAMVELGKWRVVKFSSPNRPTEFALAKNNDDEFGDLFEVNEFKTYVFNGMFIPYDGDGHPMKNDEKLANTVWNDRGYLTLPEGTTHVRWYNK